MKSPIAERGFEPPKSAIIDGKFHRFSTNHASSDTAGWYVLNQDGDIVYGGFGKQKMVGLKRSLFWMKKLYFGISKNEMVSDI